MNDIVNNGASPSDENLECEFEDEYCCDAFPLGIFEVTIDEETLRRMEEKAITMSPEMQKAAQETILRVLKQFNEE